MRRDLSVQLFVHSDLFFYEIIYQSRLSEINSWMRLNYIKMELIIPVTIYLLFLTYFTVKRLISLFHSDKPVIKGLAWIVASLFFACQLWGFTPFLMNENGVSFTIGWFGLMYFLVVSFTIFTSVLMVLHLIDRKV